MPSVNPPRIKFWPNKENRTVELEIDTSFVTISVEMDLEQAFAIQDDLRDAVQIVETDYA